MRSLLFLVPVLLAGCDYRSGPLPTAAEAARADKAISTVPCIGNTNRWERRYQYRARPSVLRTFFWKLDPRTIEFRLKTESQFADAGVMLLPPDPPLNWGADSTPTDMAGSNYHLSNGGLTIDFCGSNVPQ